MKTKIFRLLMLCVATSALILASCSSDDDGDSAPTCTDGIQNGTETGVDCGGSCDPCIDPTELNGSLTEDTTLDASVAYKLTGTLSVESGATLTIPAGTSITANVETGEETSTYIVVQKGAMIDIQGTASAPVVMTSANENKGDWGGLVIAGDATTTKGTDATAEVGNIIYGGSNDTDDSGSIDYLIINYAGAQINSESQYNGLTLYAVGSGTTISNVALLNGDDDGVEFFGGTVSASNFYMENNSDDAIDWTEGWNGTLTNAYVLHTEAGFSTAVEADGDNGNPTLTNLTALSTQGGTALQFKKESGATITGLSLSGYETILDFRDGGAPSNVQIEGADSDPNELYANISTVDVNSFSWATGISGSSILSGNVTSDLTLDASVAYELQGTLSVESGATLTIPAGTTITADVQAFGATSTYIVVQKGAMIDIQGTADAPVVMTSSDQAKGDWGGLVIAGDATTTKGTDATAEVGNIIYGGSNDTDDSGSIDYLIINYAGAQINSESQYNGLTLYAVGSGTTISNVALLNGDDDGVEFFGGTVSASNFYMENNSDDAIDWTEGWNGTLTNAYVLHTEAGFSTAVEADGDNGNPTLTNLTALSTQGGTALQFKKESGATITGLSLSGYETILDFRDGGAPSNVQIEGADSDPNELYANIATVDVNSFAWATGNDITSSAILKGNVTSDLTLDATTAYTLQGTLSVESGATLTIPAGTTITADVQAAGATSTYIVVQKGGMIDVQGTAAAPVIMTSNGETAGDWGGLVIAGDAATTKGTDATAEVGNIIYGGSNNTDNSGSIDYLIINYAGAQINSESQYNGLTLYAVGSGTTISNVAILNGADDGVEFFGGTVSASNFYMENNQDDAIDWTEGWNGTLSNAYVLHTEAGFSTAVEADGDNNMPTLENLTVLSTQGGTALQFKKESGATITGLSISGYETILDFRDGGAPSNVQIEGADSDPNELYANIATVDVNSFAWATGNDITSSAILKGNVTSDLTLDATTAYTLQGTLSVESGATLTIPAGTTITADVQAAGATSTYIVVQKGGMIDVQGTAAAPVIMTSNGETAGDWGGLVIAGDAATTKGTDATAEVGNIIYGGSNNTDNSGSIDYLIINYAGAQINSESQYNGLTLYAVGSGTTISNVAILNGADDGVEFFGGTVSASNFYMENNQDDAIDWTEGWNGTLTDAYVLHSVAGFSTAVEADGDNANPNLVNLTCVSSVGGTALQFKKESGATITGLSLSGYDTSIDFRDGGALTNVTIDGVTSDPTAAYNNAATVDVTIFDWATTN